MSIQHPPIHAAPTITGISSSYSMACVVVSGSVWCFGNNASGRLGNGTKISSKNAVRVIRSDNKPLTQVTAVDTAGSRTCAVSQGQVWCWGSSFIYAQPDSTKAKQIITHTGKPLTNVTQISLGYGHACALSRGNVWCWGNNQMGQVGVGRYEDINKAMQVRTTDFAILTSATAITTGWEHSCAVASNVVYCWGNNRDAQLGSMYSSGFVYSSWLAMRTQAALTNVTDISAGKNHTCAIDTRQVYCWGNNEYGAIGGTGSSRVAIKVYTATNTPLNNVSKLSNMDADSYTTCAIKSGNQWCWGENTWQSLGDGTRTHRSRAVLSRINGIPFSRISFSASSSSTCVANNNQLWCWGYLRWVHDSNSKFSPYRIHYSTGQFIP